MGDCEHVNIVPLMYCSVKQVLTIPHFSCDLERTFSMWKRVRPDKQLSLKEGKHKAYVSSCFNGTVPGPK